MTNGDARMRGWPEKCFTASKWSEDAPMRSPLIFLLATILAAACSASSADAQKVTGDSLLLSYQYGLSPWSSAPVNVLKLELYHSGKIAVSVWTAKNWSKISESNLSAKDAEHIFAAIKDRDFGRQLKNVDNDIIGETMRLECMFVGEDFDGPIEKLSLYMNDTVIDFSKHDMARFALTYPHVQSLIAVNDVFQELAKHADELAPTALGKSLVALRNSGFGDVKR